VGYAPAALTHPTGSDERWWTLNLLTLDDAEAAACKAAALIANGVRAAIATRGRAFIALSGGRTPWAMMRALAREDLSWRNVHIFQVDERVVPRDSPQRTLTQLDQSLLSSLLSQPDVHPMPVEEADIAAAAARYGALLKQVAGLPPVLDVVHLGLGSDGHTASLVPDDPVLAVVDEAVAISNPYEGVRRMTLTYPILNQAGATIWLITGVEKASVLQRFLAGDILLPASHVRRDRAVIVADKPAARFALHKTRERL
jgi:6-phosphogluconolactonase